METALSYRTNRGLFSNYYLDEHLPETEEWDEISEAELREAYEEISELWNREKELAPDRNESQLEQKFIRPMFQRLGIPFEVEETVEQGQRRPDYGFFESDKAAENAFKRRNEGGDFYEYAIAVADAKRWGRKLDTRGKKKRDYENPSHQIDQYLRKTSTRWGVLTNGQKWRLYYRPTSHKLDSYYEIDLPTILEKGDLEDFKYFYLFFHHEAFLEDASGDSFLDDVFHESNVFAQELGEDLQDNIYDAIKVLSEGFLQYPENDLNEDDLDLIHDSSLIYLYRLIFVLYAESEGRDLLNTDNEFYEQFYSLNSLKQEIAEEFDSGNSKYRNWQDNLWSQLKELFELIDQGSKSHDIPPADLYIPAYNGGLFRTHPDTGDSREARFLATYKVGDAYLARVIELLTRSQDSNGGGKIFVDYSSLDVRHLGSIYEGLLEYQLNVADEPLALSDGEYVIPDEGGNIVVEEGEIYLTTDSGERKATGSYYTPEYVVEYIVENTLGPLIDDIYEDLLARDPFDKEGGGQFAQDFAERVFNLKILDPAMGSGHFLTNSVNYLARQIIEAQQRQDEQMDEKTTDEHRDINWARRKVAQRCIYGVDLNPLATELAKVSLWLRTLAAEQPLAFLDHHLKTGNSLVGSDIENVLANSNDEPIDGQLTLEQSFAHTRQQALEHVMDRFQDLLSIDNETLEDAKKMEDVYDEVRDDPLYQHLLAMVNVHTAKQYGLDVPSDADKRMAEALRSDSWDNIEGQDWFKSAQSMAAEESFFHWELEFPVAFYKTDGTRIEGSGFDAIIGNPPYGDILDETAKRYCRKQGIGFESERADVFTAFVALPEHILSIGGAWSYIIPNTPLKGKQYQEFRRSNSQRYTIQEIVDFGDSYVFDEEVFTMIVSALNEEPMDTYAGSLVEGDSSSIYDQPLSLSIEPATANPWRVIDKIEAKITGSETTLELEPAICTCHDAGIDYKVSGQGWQNRGKGTSISDLIMYEGEKESEMDHRYVGGGEIERYQISPENKWLRHDYESFVEGDIVIQVYPNYTEVDEKILTRQTADTLVGAIDTNELYTAKSVHTTLLNHDKYNLWFVLSLMNSSVLRYVYRSRSGEEGRTFAQVRIHELRDLPIRRIDFELAPDDRQNQLSELYEKFDSNISKENTLQIRTQRINQVVLHDFLSLLARKRSTYTDRRYGYNLNLLDYLGNYADGPALPDIGLFQPTGENVLDATTEDYEKFQMFQIDEKLQVERARVKRDGSTVTIEATARYKPVDEDTFETGSYGYTETDFLEAFTLTDLSDKEAALIEAFVPIAVDEEIGGFRDNATKNNSLVDRLKAMILPDPDAVADDLDRYVETKKRADELDAKIEKTDRLIDEIVYDLYDLTDEEIEIVESAVADD
ncbi:Eco57I restriction-modification methylase domain-containing protein [Halalkalicoccus jeotgali]|uniref:site-specific DNA-methyltransferase (adenine-specific) n=1 Tax=Halalkalicoccus jeotgali (strain DSM 18796 / CECT 7217 / JCM 14584 / KCTC 4019 / B3) TaxID=795797 RepID=D8JCQ5_HALJB|nr:TaqI-like C-terminal specificity domain-containing protein [Halalkalicoccus jeotgali]ADJ16800.1 putative restriction/modification enzyme [Halalkalicoccus jeotgali B3]ADJ17194.1 putative restriction/modification enzyme [Halalkalicoccus jeotgali B3]ELY41673.1 putative restriction/modification enzyme [Halalkalicoccus jeotgali B3]